MMTTPAEDFGINAGDQIITTEWLVTILRWLVFGIFGFFCLFTKELPGFDIQLLCFFIVLGIIYNIYAIYLLYSGRVQSSLPHFISFFLSMDILILVSLVFFSNLYEKGLLLFYLFLIIIVALRARFLLSLILGPILVLSYFITTYMLQVYKPTSPARMVLDIIGLILVAAFCGWFAEGKSKAYLLAEHLSRRLKKISDNLDETKHQLGAHRELEKMRRDFIAIMSHELRTPLTGIIGYIDLFLLGGAGPINEEQKDYLEEMLEKSEELKNQIDNLLDLSKIQSGRWRLNLERIDPREIVEKTLTSIKNTTRSKDIEIIHLPSDKDPPPEIVADRSKVVSVISNIVGNAIKFTPGGGKIWIKEELASDSSLNLYCPHLISNTLIVKFSISDNGAGIPEDERQRIFDRFYRGRDWKSTFYPPGSGLGLSIAKEIIEMHWGRLWYEQTPGGGSTFCFTLPVNLIRPRYKIELIKSYFDLVSLLEGIIIQFEREIISKHISIKKIGWPESKDTSLDIFADRQLLQSVFFRNMHNQVRYASTGSAFLILLEKQDETITIRIESEGETMTSEMLSKIHTGALEEYDQVSSDLRRANVNLNMAFDIIESHGGHFKVENIADQGLATTIILPLFYGLNRKEREG